MSTIAGGFKNQSK